MLIASPSVGSAQVNLQTTKSKTFILVHGSWHSSGHWQRLALLLGAAGHAVIAPDLPGHGLSAQFPKSYFQRPIDLSRFSTEASPLAGVTLDQYVEAISESINFARKAGLGPIILVGHSMGGVTTTAVVEQYAKQIHHVVYLAAFMPNDGASALSYLSAPENAASAFGPLLLGDPAKTGCVRIDVRSADPKYVAVLQLALYNDVDLPTFEAACQSAHTRRSDRSFRSAGAPNGCRLGKRTAQLCQNAERQCLAHRIAKQVHSRDERIRVQKSNQGLRH